MADVDAPEAAKQCLLPLYIEAHRSGHPRRETDAAKTAFNGIEWGERYFGRWRRRFEEGGTFPYMWKKYKEFYTAVPSPPVTIKEATAYLRVPEMRKLLTDLGAMPAKGRPKKRKEFIVALSGTERKAEIVAAAMPRYQNAVHEHEAQARGAKCELLAHTLAMRSYTLVYWYNFQRRLQHRSSESQHWKWRLRETDCPVESEYAAKHMTGKMNGLPPFFPGDRSSFIYEYC